MNDLIPKSSNSLFHFSGLNPKFGSGTEFSKYHRDIVNPKFNQVITASTSTLTEFELV